MLRELSRTPDCLLEHSRKLIFTECVGKTDQNPTTDRPKTRPPTQHRPTKQFRSSDLKSGRVGDVTDPTYTDCRSIWSGRVPTLASTVTHLRIFSSSSQAIHCSILLKFNSSSNKFNIKFNSHLHHRPRNRPLALTSRATIQRTQNTKSTSFRRKYTILFKPHVLL